MEDDKPSNYVEFKDDIEELGLTKKKKKKRMNRLWRRIMDDKIEGIEDELKMVLDIFTAQHKIPNYHYKLEIKCKVNFDFE